MLAVAGGWAWYISQHQKPAISPNRDIDNTRPSGGSFTLTTNGLWNRQGTVRARSLIPKQTEIPGTSIGWFVEMLDGTLMEAHGSRENIMRKVRLVRPENLS